MADFRIALDGRSFAGPPNGYTTYTGSIAAVLREHGFSVTLLTDQALSSRFEESRELPVELLPGKSGLRGQCLAHVLAIRAVDAPVAEGD